MYLLHILQNNKELERLVAINKIGMSVDRVLDVVKTITTIKICMPENGMFFIKHCFLTDKHRVLSAHFSIYQKSNF